MANILNPAPDTLWDADQRLVPRVRLNNGKTGDMFHLERSQATHKGANEGDTGVNTVYMPGGQLVDLFKGMGKLPTGPEFVAEANRLGLQSGHDYRMVPYQLPDSIQAVDQNPPVGDWDAMLNGLVRGGTNVLFAGESGKIRDAMLDSQLTNAAYNVGGAGDRVTDLSRELDRLGRGDLTGQTRETLLARAPKVKKLLRSRLVPAIHEHEAPDEEDPTFVSDNGTIEEAQAAVDRQQKFTRSTQHERNAIQQLEGTFTYPPVTLGGGRDSRDPRLDNPDSLQMAIWAKSMTPEQRAATTPEMVTAKGKQIRTARRAKEIVDAFSAKAKTEQFLKGYQGTSKAAAIYGKEDAGYGTVNDELGWRGVAVLLAEQGLESAPSTVATMAATAVAGALTGGSGIAVAIGMGGSTTAMGMGGNFTSAFGKWVTTQDRDIKLSDLGNYKSLSFQKLLALADKDPVTFMDQMDQMTAAGDKRAIAEGITAVALNKLGDFGMSKLDDVVPHGLFKKGSPLWAMRSTISRPRQLADGFFWRKSLGPKLANAAKNSGWEAVEEGLTEVITSIAVGDEIDPKTALSSFFVGGLMGGTSNFVAGVQNVDDPLALLSKKVLNNELGMDEVAKQISRNTGMPVKHAKAAILRAQEKMKDWEKIKQSLPQASWASEKKKFLAGLADPSGALKHHDPDKQQIHMADARAVREALIEELKIQRLEAFSPGKVKPDPRIKGIGDYLMIQNSNPAPGYDPARYTPPAPTGP